MSASFSLPGTENHEARIVIRAIATLCAVMLFGTVGFLLIEQDWTLWDSLYFTLITITTVGYGDMDISPAGQRFAALLLVSGIGTATWTLTTVVQFAVSYQFEWQRRMKKMINKTSNHIVICGFGRIGRTICAKLAESDVLCVVIDCQEAAIADALACGYMAVLGNSTDETVLRDAGLDRARGIVCATSSDAENVFITLTAREINPNVMIASRANAESSARRMEHAGATLVVSPFLTAGADIARAIVKPHLAELLRNSHRSDGDFALSEVKVEPGSILEGQTPRSYGQEEDSIAFIAIKREGSGTIYRPGGQETFRPHDVIIAAGVPDALARMSTAAHPRRANMALV
ncbi:MAG: potassium channel protein [Planctomycetota bacterium]|nr:potassium channel protein [Planctomycetota bacterium]